MNWDAVGAVAEILGSLTVIATLFYLALQVRHARDQIRTSTRETRHTRLGELFLAPTQSPELTRVIGKGIEGWTKDIETEEQFFESAKFTIEDRILYQSYQRAWWYYVREAVATRHDLTPSQLQEVNREIIALYSSRGPGSVYLSSMSSIDTPALKYVRELISSNDNSTGALRSSLFSPEV
jgi:hypothetical protein